MEALSHFRDASQEAYEIAELRHQAKSNFDRAGNSTAGKSTQYSR